MSNSVVRVHALEFGWHKRADRVLSIPLFEMQHGEKVFLQGPSGSGKTTLLSLLGGVVKPDQGSVVINGSEISAMSGARRDRIRVNEIGFIFQMFNLISYLSPVQNVCLPCRFSTIRTHRATAERPLVQEAARLLGQLGLDGALIHRRSSELSVGQQQRVAAARALIGAPPLVIADEPTSSLDSDARFAFLELLFEECHRNSASVLFVSHDQSLASQFDRTVNLADINQVAAQ